MFSIQDLCICVHRVIGTLIDTQLEVLEYYSTFTQLDNKSLVPVGDSVAYICQYLCNVNKKEVFHAQSIIL